MNEHLFFGEQDMEGGWLCDCRARSYFPSAVKQSLPLSPPCGRPIPSCLHICSWQGCCLPVTAPHLPPNPLPRPPVPSFSVVPNSSELVSPAPCFMCAEPITWPSHGPFTRLTLDFGFLSTYLISPRICAPETGAACGPVFLQQWR